MKIGVIGAGLTGCALARLLTGRRHKVIIFEKNYRIGGLCVSNRHENGLLYEPYGARTFHTAEDKIREFALKYSRFNGYRHRKGIVIEGKLLPFPITRETISLLSAAGKIKKELKSRPKEIDRSNFETACISIFGPTLYKYFISNYSRRMWGRSPKELSAHWAPKRLVLRDDDTGGLFKNEWQGLPIEGYSVWLERMIEGIDVETGVEVVDTKNFDMVVSTAPIDEIAGYRYGRLEYRSLKFIYTCVEDWEDDRYGTINLPQHRRFIRKCNFKVLHRLVSAKNLIQYQQPCDVDSGGIPMYPVHTERNELLFRRYLSYVVSLTNLCPAGRLGLFEYLDMDEAIAYAIQIVPLIEKYRELPPQERREALMKVRRTAYDESNHSGRFKN
jgi:UDP-galactopyranose mutase